MSERAAARADRSDTPLRVLFVSHAGELAGAERSYLDLVRGVAAEGRIVPVAMLPRGGALWREIEQLGVQAHPLRPQWWLARRNALPVFLARMVLALVQFPFLLARIARIRPDVVHTNSLVLPSPAVAARVLRIPHVWHVRELLESDPSLRSPLPTSAIVRIVRSLSARIVAVSHAAARPFEGASVEVVPNGVADAPLCLPAPRDGASAVMTMVGTISDNKGQVAAIRAFADVVRTFPDAVLWLVGTGEPRYVELLRNEAVELGVASKVRFVGQVADPTPYVRASDVVLVLSKGEAFGRVTIEALRLGVPVLGTASGGTVEILGAGGGVLVPACDDEALARELGRLLGDPARMRELRSRARTVGAAYSLERVVERVTSALEATAAQARKRSCG